MKQSVYHQGSPGLKYGIWDPATHRWQYGIREDTPMLAVARLYQKLGAEAKKKGFQPRPLPKEWTRRQL